MRVGIYFREANPAFNGVLKDECLSDEPVNDGSEVGKDMVVLYANCLTLQQDGITRKKWNKYTAASQSPNIKRCTQSAVLEKQSRLSLGLRKKNFS